MAQFGLCSGTYQSLSPQVDCEDTVNWYPEIPESPGAKTPVALYPTPGKTTFATLVGPSVRGLFPFQGMLYGVPGTNFDAVPTDCASSLIPRWFLRGAVRKLRCFPDFQSRRCDRLAAN